MRKREIIAAIADAMALSKFKAEESGTRWGETVSDSWVIRLGALTGVEWEKLLCQAT